MPQRPGSPQGFPRFGPALHPSRGAGRAFPGGKELPEVDHPHPGGKVSRSGSTERVLGKGDRMTRGDVKYVVNCILFVVLSSTAAVGLLLAFAIPSGSVPGAGRLLLGVHRHVWARFHLFLAVAFLALLAVHLWLSWGWVLQMTRRFFGERWKKALLALGCAWLLVLLLGWLRLRL
jgi:hypothetical protein